MRALGSRHPTAVELMFLQVLWDLGPSTVRQIHTQAAQSRRMFYPSTGTMLYVMLKKGLVTRDDSATPHIYRAAITRDEVAKALVKDLIEKVYNGSATSLVLDALASSKPSLAQIDEARKLLDAIEANLWRSSQLVNDGAGGVACANMDPLCQQLSS